MFLFLTVRNSVSQFLRIAFCLLTLGALLIGSFPQTAEAKPKAKHHAAAKKHHSAKHQAKRHGPKRHGPKRHHAQAHVAKAHRLAHLGRWHKPFVGSWGRHWGPAIGLGPRIIEPTVVPRVVGPMVVTPPAPTRVFIIKWETPNTMRPDIHVQEVRARSESEARAKFRQHYPYAVFLSVELK